MKRLDLSSNVNHLSQPFPSPTPLLYLTAPFSILNSYFLYILPTRFYLCTLSPPQSYLLTSKPCHSPCRDTNLPQSNVPIPTPTSIFSKPYPLTFPSHPNCNPTNPSSTIQPSLYTTPCNLIQMITIWHP